MKIRIVLNLPIPRGPKASLVQCLPSCFLSYCAISARFLLPTASLSVSVSFFLPFLLSLATRKLFYGFGLEDLSGAISPLVNKCCDRRQVEEKLEPDERREVPSSWSHVPRLIFCVTVAAFLCAYFVCMPHWLCNITDSGNSFYWNNHLRMSKCFYLKNCFYDSAIIRQCKQRTQVRWKFYPRETVKI